jgi:uncharacterized protein (DUF427 family)
MRVEEGPKRVRTYLGGEIVADTTRPKLVWEIPNYPAYYLPVDDVRMELLTPTERTERSPSRGVASYFTVKGGDRVVEDAAWHYPESPVEDLRTLIRFDWEAMDAWFEEDEEVYVHPRDPYKRVDILASGRHVEVVVDGVKVADSHQPRLLFETSLPTRYYLPLTDVRLDLLRPSATSTRCPYKGTAGYWSVEVNGAVHNDLAWIYRTPVLESVKIAGLACFFNEHVDLYVDGVLQQRPKTFWSRR